MIFKLYKLFSERKLPWKTGLAVLAIVLITWLVMFFMLDLDERSTGVMPAQETPEKAQTTTTRDDYRRHNTVQIRNEVFVLNGESLSIEQMRAHLTRLAGEHPDAVVELQTTGDEKSGMVYELEKAVEAARLKLLK